MAIVATILDLVMGLTVPWAILVINILHIPRTIKAFVASNQYAKLLSASDFTASWFANFWATIGPAVKETFEHDMVALLHGRILNSKMYDYTIS
jgi:hypothetical protein